MTPSLTPAQSAQQMWIALTNGYEGQNAQLQGQTPSNKTVLISVPNLANIELVYALALAGIAPSAAQLSAMVLQEPVPGTQPVSVSLPNYILGNQIGTNPNVYVLDDTEGIPSVDTFFMLNGVTYKIGAISPFTFTAIQQ